MPAGTDIYFKAIARNDAGYAYADELTFITQPDQIILEAPTKVDNDAFTVHWDETTGADSYNLYVSTDS